MAESFAFANEDRNVIHDLQLPFLTMTSYVLPLARALSSNMLRSMERHLSYYYIESYDMFRETSDLGLP